MTDSLFVENTGKHSCSFCGKNSDDSSITLIYHIGVNICSNCVGHCDALLEKRHWFRPGDIEYLSWFNQSTQEYDDKYSEYCHFSDRYLDDLTEAGIALDHLRADLAERDAEIERLRGMTPDVVLDVLASLVAAVSLLKKGSKKVAPSDKMFDVMISGYERSIERARAALNAAIERTK